MPKSIPMAVAKGDDDLNLLERATSPGLESCRHCLVVKSDNDILENQIKTTDSRMNSKFLKLVILHVSYRLRNSSELDVPDN